MKGCLFKRVRNGKKTGSWILRYQGQEQSLKTVDKLTAEEKARKIIRDRQREAEGIQSPQLLVQSASKPLLHHVSDYVENLRTKNCSPEHCLIVEKRLNKLFPECHWMQIKDISVDSFELWRSKNKAKAAKTLNEYLSAASAFLTWMQKVKRTLENPLRLVDKVEQRGHETRKRRAFTTEEVQSLLNASPPSRRLAYVIALFTGLRKNEVQNLEWRDIDLDKQRIVLRDEFTKNKNPDIIHIPQELLSELRKERAENQDPSQRVVPFVPEYRTMQKDLEKAGIPYRDPLGRQVDFHSFRMTLATWLIDSGANALTVQKIMRHSDLKTTNYHYYDASQTNFEEALSHLPRLGGIPQQKRTLKSRKTAYIGDNQVAPIFTLEENDELTKPLLNKGETHFFASICASVHEGENGCPTRIRK